MKQKAQKPAVGRAFFDGQDEGRVVAKLEYAFAIGCNVLEASNFAGISRFSFYRYCSKHPEFRNRLDELAMRPILLAKKSLIEGIEKNGHLALAYLKIRRPQEYSSTRTAIPREPIAARVYYA